MQVVMQTEADVQPIALALTLTVYLASEATREMWAALRDAEEMSIATCEVCGAPGRLAERKAWWAARCVAHENWTPYEKLEYRPRCLLTARPIPLNGRRSSIACRLAAGPDVTGRVERRDTACPGADRGRALTGCGLRIS